MMIHCKTTIFSGMAAWLPLQTTVKISTNQPESKSHGVFSPRSRPPAVLLCTKARLGGGSGTDGDWLRTTSLKPWAGFSN